MYFISKNKSTIINPNAIAVKGTLQTFFFYFELKYPFKDLFIINTELWDFPFPRLETTLKSDFPFGPQIYRF